MAKVSFTMLKNGANINTIGTAILAKCATLQPPATATLVR